MKKNADKTRGSTCIVQAHILRICRVSMLIDHLCSPQMVGENKKCGREKYRQRINLFIYSHNMKLLVI